MSCSVTPCIMVSHKILEERRGLTSDSLYPEGFMAEHIQGGNFK